MIQPHSRRTSLEEPLENAKGLYIILELSLQFQDFNIVTSSRCLVFIKLTFLQFNAPRISPKLLKVGIQHLTFRELASRSLDIAHISGTNPSLSNA
jgi:hypothetical protein